MKHRLPNRVTQRKIERNRILKSKQLTMSRGTSLAVSHTIFFLLGVTCTQLYNKDELNSYRGKYEKGMQRFRRYVCNAGMGTLALGSVWLTISIMARGNRKNDSSSGNSNSSMTTA